MSATSNAVHYELMLVLTPSLTEKEVEKELATVKGLLDLDKDGTVSREQVWGKRDLYYTLKGHAKGIYAVLNFTAGSAVSLPKELKLMPHVLRFLLRRMPENYEFKPIVLEEEKVENKTMPAREKKAVRAPRPKKATFDPTAPVPAASTEESKLRARKEKKADFDTEIDRIIENLDKL
jgi:small subunit ribosomal protein S6